MAKPTALAHRLKPQLDLAVKGMYNGVQPCLMWHIGFLLSWIREKKEKIVFFYYEIITYKIKEDYFLHCMTYLPLSYIFFL
jgi:hypothetical protein